MSLSALPELPLSDLVVDTQYGTAAVSNTTGQGVPVLRMNNLGYDGSFDFSSMKWVDLPQHELEKVLVQRDDLLFNRTNSRELVGKTAVWDREDKMAFAGYLIRVRFRRDLVIPKYVSAYLNSPHGKATLFHMAKPSVNMANISATDLLRVRVPIPSLPYQEKVAAILDKADGIRRKRREAIALTEDLLRSTFLEMFGDPVTNPKGWPAGALTKLGVVTTGNTPSRANPDFFGNDIEWIKSDNINTSKHILTRATEGLSALGRTISREVPSGSTLMTCIAGSPDCIGNIGLADRAVSFNQQINAITPHSAVDYRFLYVLLLVSKPLIQATSTNSMKGMVSKGKLEQVVLPLPPTSLQRDFGRTFDRLAALGTKQGDAASEGDKLFDSLVDRAFRSEF